VTAALHGIVFFCGWLLVFVRLAALRTRVRYRRVAVLRVCSRRRRRSLAVHVAHECDTCPVIVYVAVAVSHCCSVRTGSDCDTAVEVLRVPPGVAALDAAARGRGRVCNAVLLSCITSLVTSTLSVQRSGVCSCGAVCVGVCVYVAL
jgi:hypothetical protein